MIEVEQKGLAKGLTLKVFTCETKEEAQENGLPDGTFTFWILNGAKIVAPGELIKNINELVINGKLEVQEFISRENVAKYHSAVKRAQSELFLNTMNEQLKRCDAMPEPYKTQHKKVIQEQIDKFKRQEIIL